MRHARATWLFVAAILAFLPGCAAVIQPTLRDAVEIKSSQFETQVTFRGVEVAYGGNLHNKHFLRSWFDTETGVVVHQLYVINQYSGGWAMWRRANDEDAQSLPFTSISRDVVSCSAYGGCLYREHFGVTIPDSVLRARVNGYSIKFYAQSGRELVIHLTAEQIDAQLQAIDRYSPRPTT